jgi:hypothetical protein
MVTVCTTATAGFDFSIDNMGFDEAPPTPTPEPGSLALLGAGLAALGVRHRRHKTL